MPNIPSPGRLASTPPLPNASAKRLREAVLQRDIARLMLERDALRGQVDNAAQAAEHDRLRLEERDQTIAALYGSTSWRISAPLRLASSCVRRLLGRSHRVPVFQSASVLPLPPAMLAQPQQATRPTVPPLPAHAGRGTILVAADCLPLFDHSSGGLRLMTVIRMMQDLGWSMVFASFANLNQQPGILGQTEGRKRYETVLSEAGVSRCLYGLEEIETWLRSEGRSLTWAFLSFPMVTEAILPWVRSYCPTARVLYDMVDFHALRIEREARLKDDAGLLQTAARWRAIEIACARGADITLAVTLDEKKALLEIAPDAVVEVLPNVFEIPPEPRPGLEARDGLLFVGGFWHQPNGDAMVWFVERIWPLIRAEQPELVLRIAGSNPGNDVLALGTRPGVEVLGFVPDLTPLLDGARVFVAPLRYGAGMKGKVGQSLLYGLPVVATPVGAEGMDLQDGAHLLVAAEEQEFAAAVLTLLRDDALWSHLAERGRQHIIERFSTDVVRTQIRALLDG